MTSARVETPLDRYRGIVLPDWIDYNGHLNLAFYMVAFDHATDLFFDYIGLDHAYRSDNEASTFAAEAHLVYQRELHEGDPLRITTQLIAFDEKRLRFFHRMFHAAEGYQAAASENLSLHVDMRRRKVAPMGEALLRRAGDVKRAHDALGPPAEAGRAIVKPPFAVAE